MKRDGIRFVIARMVVTLPHEIAKRLNADVGWRENPYPGSYLRFAQVVQGRKWSLGEPVPRGCVLRILNVPEGWVKLEELSPDELATRLYGSVTVPWPVEIIPCLGFSRTNMMYGPRRVFWAEGGYCYSTSTGLSEIDRKRLPEARRVAREVAAQVEAERSIGAS